MPMSVELMVDSVYTLSRQHILCVSCLIQYLLSAVYFRMCLLHCTIIHCLRIIQCSAIQKMNFQHH